MLICRVLRASLLAELQRGLPQREALVHYCFGHLWLCKMLQPEATLQHCKSEENNMVFAFALIAIGMSFCKHCLFSHRNPILPFGIESRPRAIAFLMTLMSWSMPNSRRSSWAKWVHFYTTSPIFQLVIFFWTYLLNKLWFLTGEIQRRLWEVQVPIQPA